MRFHLGPVPDDFTPDSSWRPLREPGPVMLQVFALPVALGNLVLFAWGWQRVGGVTSLRIGGHQAALEQTMATSAGETSLRIDGDQAGLFFAALVLSIPALVVVHELLHAVVHPGAGRSAATVLGAWPRRLLFYAHYAGSLSRDRYLAVFAMPFLLISVLPLIIAATGLLPPAAAFWAAWFSIWNAMFACGDCIGFALLLFQVPRAAMVQNQSWSTYWRPMT